MLIATTEAPEETQQLPPQVSTLSAGHHQPEAVGGTHFVSHGERTLLQRTVLYSLFIAMPLTVFNCLYFNVNMGIITENTDSLHVAAH